MFIIVEARGIQEFAHSHTTNPIGLQLTSSQLALEPEILIAAACCSPWTTTNTCVSPEFVEESIRIQYYTYAESSERFTKSGY